MEQASQLFLESDYVESVEMGGRLIKREEFLRKRSIRIVKEKIELRFVKYW